MLILRNCRLIPELTEGFEGQYADLVLENKKIKEIRPAGLIQTENQPELDMQNMTVVPGFFDLHAHLMFLNQDYNASMLRESNQYLLDCMASAKSYLRQGYTTIRDCGNDFYAGVYVRSAVESGLVQGCRVITSGKILSPTTRGNKCFGTLYKEIDDPQQMLGACRYEMSQGVDFIKYMATGAVLNEGGVPGAMVTTPEELAAITKAADSLGTYVAAHCHGTEGIYQAILHGVHTIEHASYLDERCIELILAKGNQTALIPTCAIAYTVANEMYPGGVLPEFVDKSRDAGQHMQDGARMAMEAGIAVGWGSDLDMEFRDRYPGLEFMARKGMNVPNVALLRQATIDSAKIVGMEDVCGTIKEGKYADLAVFDGKPDEDLDVLKKLPVYVFKEGKQFIE